MKKIIGAMIVITLTILFCVGCKVSNTELANSLDGNMTRLVYSIGYLDSISTNEIQELSVNSAYFQNYNATNSIESYSGADTFRNANYRGNVYNSVLNSENMGTYTNSTTNQNANYCPNCNSLLSNLGAENNLTTTATNELSTINTGNATTNTLGGLCTECNNAINTLNQANTITDTNSTQSATNYVDISLLMTSAEDLNEILLNISQKRGIIMLYCTDLRSGNIELGEDDKAAISEYITIIKETINYLNNNSSTLTAHMNNIRNYAGVDGSQEVINAKLIRVNEVLKTRYAKLDTCTDSLDAIITILQRNVGIDYTSRFLTGGATTDETTQSIISDLNNVNSTNINSNSITTPISETTTSPITNNTTTTTSETITNSSQNNQLPIDNNCCQNNCSNLPTDCTIENPNCFGCNEKCVCNNTNQLSNSLPINQSTTTPNQTTNTITTTNNNCLPQNNTSNTNSICHPQSNCTTITSPVVTDSENVLNGLASRTNPHGIGIKSNDATLTGVPYNSTSVNAPRPGTLISSITLPNSIVSEPQNIEPTIPQTPEEEILANTPMILPELEQNVSVDETPAGDFEPQFIKELGMKSVLINPIYDSSSNLKPLPFVQGI